MQYERLNPNLYETRLLKLHPISSGDATKPHKPIVCELLHGVFMIGRPPRCPKYNALSYCWGDQSITEPIVVDRRVVPVTKNLKAALMEIRRTSTEPCLLWIDALCIDQANEYEKSEQIKQMGKIFESAQRVIVWVGVPETAEQENKASLYLQDPRAISQLDASPSEDFKACIRTLGDAAFWRRAWIIQELAKGEPLDVRYGQLSIPWYRLKNVLFDPRIIHHLPQDFYDLIRVLDRFQSRERDNSTGGRRVSLLEALFESRKSLSTDPRDKIYALLDLSSDGKDIVPSPNYVQSWDEVYSDAAENIIAGRCQIAAILLAASKGPEGARALPSWVPDWFTLSNVRVAPWVVKCLQHSADSSEAQATRIGRARETSDIPINVENRCLRLPGVVYETVDAVFATASRAAKSASVETALQHRIDVRTFAWHLYHTINWTNGKFKDFTVDRHKTWTSHFTDITSVLGDKLHSLGLTTLENFMPFLRLLLDEYEDIEESIHLSRIRQWMQNNGSLKIGPATVQEMLREQLSAMQLFFFKGDHPALDVTPPPIPDKSKVHSTVQQHDLGEEEGKPRWARHWDRLKPNKSPSPSRKSSQEMRPSSGDEPVKRRLSPSGLMTLSETRFRGLSAEVLATLRSLLTNRKPPAAETVATIANGLERLDTSNMRLVATDSRIRVVHENAEVGDQIAVLANCPLPVVLRPASESELYSYIGEGYSESFARSFEEGWGDRRVLKSWPDIWEVEGVKIKKKGLITIQ